MKLVGQSQGIDLHINCGKPDSPTAICRAEDRPQHHHPTTQSTAQAFPPSPPSPLLSHPHSVDDKQRHRLRQAIEALTQQLWGAKGGAHYADTSKGVRIVDLLA